MAIAKLGELDERFSERAGKQMVCAGWLCVREVTAGPLKGENRLHAGMFCQQPLTCPHCAHRRAVANMRAYLPRVEALIDEDAGREVHWGTLTVRNAGAVGAAFKALDRGLKRWVRTVMEAGRRGGGVLSRIEGGLAAIETKRGGLAGLWHVHCHVLLVTRGRPDYAGCLKSWRRASCDGEGYAKFGPLHSQRLLMKGACKRGDEHHKAQLGRDLAEIIKYPMKFPDIDVLEVWEVAQALQRRHLLRPFGCLRGVEVPESLLDAPLNWAELEWADRWWRYAGGGRYAEHEGMVELSTRSEVQEFDAAERRKEFKQEERMESWQRRRRALAKRSGVDSMGLICRGGNVVADIGAVQGAESF